MEGEYFTFQAQPQVYGGDEAYILGVYNNCNPSQVEKVKKKKSKENCVKLATEIARKRRQKIGEKTRCLQKLLPWNTKMDTATMLGEAAKYVKFLQAQICVLKTCTSSSSSTSTSTCLEKELLAEMLNSAEVQTVLSRNGWCLYTLDQVPHLLNNNLLHGMLWNYY